MRISFPSIGALRTALNASSSVGSKDFMGAGLRDLRTSRTSYPAPGCEGSCAEKEHCFFGKGAKSLAVRAYLDSQSRKGTSQIPLNMVPKRPLLYILCG